jgi:hypothetical protein
MNRELAGLPITANGYVYRTVQLSLTYHRPAGLIPLPRMGWIPTPQNSPPRVRVPKQGYQQYKA